MVDQNRTEIKQGTLEHPELSLKKDKIFTSSNALRKTKIVCTLG
jgi:hypothetical protein